MAGHVTVGQTALVCCREPECREEAPQIHLLQDAKLKPLKLYSKIKQKWRKDNVTLGEKIAFCISPLEFMLISFWNTCYQTSHTYCWQRNAAFGALLLFLISRALFYPAHGQGGNSLNENWVKTEVIQH